MSMPKFNVIYLFVRGKYAEPISTGNMGHVVLFSKR